MKESISYTFLLNIIIVFIFACAAIIMGVLSYYKAFRANTIISEAIEKYEGYNCLAKEEIARKLPGIGYMTPFNVKCKSSDGKCDDSGESYKVISYNLDVDGNLVYKDEPMNSTYECKKVANSVGIQKNSCTTNKHYQYGIYTYMYVELPVISSLIKIPLFTKTSIIYEFRNFYIEDSIVEGLQTITDTEQIFPIMYNKEYTDNKIYVEDAYYGNKINMGNQIRRDMTATEMLAEQILPIYSALATGTADPESAFMTITKDGSENYRTRMIYELMKAKGNNTLDSVTYAQIYRNGLNGEYFRRNCGTKFDYSIINY